MSKYFKSNIINKFEYPLNFKLDIFPQNKTTNNN